MKGPCRGGKCLLSRGKKPRKITNLLASSLNSKSDLGSPIWPSKLLSTEKCTFLPSISRLGKFFFGIRQSDDETDNVTGFIQNVGSSGIHGAAADTAVTFMCVCKA